jgi:hypothetical protein
MLVFSLFNLTGAPDMARVSGAVNIGIVNLDAGLTIPPINVADRAMAGMAQRLPFGRVQFDDEASARAAIAREEIAAILIFPEGFSKAVFSPDPVPFGLVTAGNLTRAESQISGQLPGMIEMALTGAVSSIRLALAKGQMSDATSPLALTVENTFVAKNAAAQVAPFVADFTTWLAAMVGAMLLFQATKLGAGGTIAAGIRTLVPVAATLIASFVLTITLAATSGISAGFMQMWLSVWIATLALSWLFGGAFSLMGMPVLIIALPLVFYQAAIGGTQMPVAGAADWLAKIGGWLGADQIGAVYRSLIIGGNNAMPWPSVLIAGSLGLAMIWAAAFVKAK